MRSQLSETTLRILFLLAFSITLLGMAYLLLYRSHTVPVLW